MHPAISLFRRRLLVIVLAPLALLGAAGCADPVIGQDTRVVLKSPGYLREAFVYSIKDAAADATGNFHAGDYRLRALVSFGEHYPGCRPGVGERYARQYGEVFLPRTAGATEIDAQEYYRDIAWNYAATYNHEMIALLGPLDSHARSNSVTVISGK